MIRAVGFDYRDLQIQKIIITFENLVGFKSLMGLVDCKILWIWYLEDIQPYIAKGASLWSFLIDIEKTGFDIDKIEADMKAKTGASYSDGFLYKYEMKIFNELTNNGAIFKGKKE